MINLPVIFSTTIIIIVIPLSFLIPPLTTLPMTISAMAVPITILFSVCIPIPMAITILFPFLDTHFLSLLFPTSTGLSLIIPRSMLQIVKSHFIYTAKNRMQSTNNNPHLRRQFCNKKNLPMIKNKHGQKCNFGSPIFSIESELNQVESIN